MPWLLIFYCWTLGLLAIAVAIDMRELRLPHHLTWSAAAIAIAGQGLWGPGWSFALLGTCVGFIIMKTAQLLCLWRSKHECIGSGDAFLMLSLGALLGVELLPWGIAASGVLAFIGAKFSSNKKLPFGPFLVMGCLGALTFTKII
jgi:prepilin signal peptidase PulO-like enzyme (type II secretory pathway)